MIYTEFIPGACLEKEGVLPAVSTVGARSQTSLEQPLGWSSNLITLLEVQSYYYYKEQQLDSFLITA